jgi:PTS system nitrogen regulatory IIA component
MLIGGESARDSVAAIAEGLFISRRVFPGLPGRTREEVLEELASRLARAGDVREPGELVARLIERERLGCTGLGGGVAIPHCKLRELADVVVAVASTEPIEFGAADGIPVTIVFLVASPAEAAAPHLQALARISRLLRAPGVADGLRAAGTPAAMLGVLRGAEADRAGAS